MDLSQIKGEIVTGYKATDENMQCRGFQFELGKWHIHDGEIAMCESGFHFGEYPSGPWAFYNGAGTRIFKVEAKGVEKGLGPGADLKHVAVAIRLVEEIIPHGNRNTGNGNTGDGNTGDWNTGDWNTGDLNTGNRNTGDRNTGDWNTGYRNTGDWNTGDWNTGDWNTGDGNATDRCSGYLCSKKQPIIIFDKVVKNEADIDWSLIRRLSEKLMSDEVFDYRYFISIPNATINKIKALHVAHIERRNKK